MAVGPFTKPATFSQEQAQAFVSPKQQSPALPVEAIAQSAQRFQKRRNAVKDELDQAMTSLASSQKLAVNQDAFMSMTQGIRDRMSQITESGDLINRREEVRKLARDVSRVKGLFDQNRKNLEDSLKNLQDQDNLTPAQRKAQRERLIQQAQMQVGPNGNPKGGLSAPKTYGDVTTPYEVVDDMDFNNLIQTVKTKRGPAEQKGVSARRVQQEALRRLGLTGKNTPTTPGLQNWKRYETQALFRQVRQENPDMEEEEVRKTVNGRLRSKMKSAVRSAINTKTRQSSRDLIEGRGQDSSGKMGSASLPEGVYTYSANPKGTTLDTQRSANIAPARKKEMRAASQIRKEEMKKNFKERFGLSFQKFQDIREMKENNPDPKARVSPTGASPDMAGRGKPLKQRVEEKHGSGVWGSYKMARDGWKRAEQVATNHQYLSLRGSEKRNELERVLGDVFGRNPQSLSIPAAQQEEWHFGGWDTAEIKGELASNFKFRGIGQNGQQLLLEYTGDETDIPGVNANDPTFTVEAPDRVREALFKEGQSDLFGERVSKIVQGNAQFSDVAVGKDWTTAVDSENTKVDLALGLRKQRDLPGVEESKTVYKVRAGEDENALSYGQVVDRAIAAGREDWLKRMTQKANNDETTPVDESLIRSAVREGGVDNLPEAAQQQFADPVTYDNKYPAIQLGIGFDQ